MASVLDASGWPSGAGRLGSGNSPSAFRNWPDLFRSPRGIGTGQRGTSGSNPPINVVTGAGKRVNSTAYDNGTFSTDDGIECFVGCLVRGNTVRSISGFGLDLDLASGSSDNVVAGN